MERDFFEALGAVFKRLGAFFAEVIGVLWDNAVLLGLSLGMLIAVIMLRAYFRRRALSALPTVILVPGWEPPTLPVGEFERLVLIGGRGRRAARDYVALALFEQANARGVFDVEDRRDEGLTLELQGDRGLLVGDPLDPVPGDYYVTIDVVEWRVERDLVGEYRVSRATVLLSVTLMSSEGEVIARDEEYERSFTAHADVDKDDLVQRTCGMAVGQLLDDLTPHVVDTPVELDLSDPAQKAALDAARKGDLRTGLAMLEEFVKTEPKSASAHYNLGVLYDALEEHEKALAAHERAMKLGPKPFYRSAARAGGEEKRHLLAAARDTQRRRRIDAVLSELSSAANDRDELIDAVLRFAATRLDTAAVFIVQRKGGRRAFVGWDIADERITRQEIREVSIPVGPEGGILGKVYDLRGPFLGPLADDDPLVEVLGRRPASCLAVPVLVGDQLAAAIYGDCGDRPVPQNAFIELQTVLPHLGEGLRELIVVSMRSAQSVGS